MIRAALLTLLAAAVLALGPPAGALHGQELVTPDRRALEAARTLVQRRATPEDVAAEMSRTYRQSPAQTAAIFRGLRLRADVTGRALMAAYRVRGDAAAPALTSGGFPTRDVVGALERLDVPLDDAATGLFAAQVPLRETADLVKEVYRADDGAIARALTRSGYTYDAPGALAYSIADYRRPGSNRRIENLGVVDPARVPGSGHPDDGTVVVRGTALNVPGVTVRILHRRGVSEGEVVDRRTRSGMDELEVRFRDFGSGELEVETPGGSAAMPALALSHVRRSISDIFDPAPTFAFGGSTASIAWGFEGGGASTDDFSPPDDALQVAVLGSAADPAVAIEPETDGATLRATFSVPTALSGTLTPQVSYWSCASYEIDGEACPVLDGPCILSELAELASSLAQCVNPEAWEERTRDGPPIPIQGSGVSNLTLSARFTVAPDGRVLGQASPSEYAGDVWSSVSLPPAQATFASADLWWEQQVVPALVDLGEPFAAAVADRLTAWPQYLPGLAAPGIQLLGIHGQPDGSLLLEFRH